MPRAEVEAAAADAIHGALARESLERGFERIEAVLQPGPIHEPHYDGHQEHEKQESRHSASPLYSKDPVVHGQ